MATNIQPPIGKIYGVGSFVVNVSTECVVEHMRLVLLKTMYSAMSELFRCMILLNNCCT